MNRVWLELKYGKSGTSSITVCRLEDAVALRAFKRRLVKKMESNFEESQAVNPILGVIDRFELSKVKTVLQILVPDERDNNEW